MAIIEGTTRVKVMQADYDFAVDGGAVGTITLRGDHTFPPGSTITSGRIDVETAVLSGTGTVAVTAETLGDLLAATNAAGFALGRRSIVPAATGVTSVKTTVARSLTITIATAALTAGKFRVVVHYQ